MVLELARLVLWHRDEAPYLPYHVQMLQADEVRDH